MYIYSFNILWILIINALKLPFICIASSNLSSMLYTLSEFSEPAKSTKLTEPDSIFLLELYSSITFGKLDSVNLICNVNIEWLLLEFLLV